LFYILFLAIAKKKGQMSMIKNKKLFKICKTGTLFLPEGGGGAKDGT